MPHHIVSRKLGRLAAACLLTATLLMAAGLSSLQAVSIAPMTWTTGRSDWINVKTDSAMTHHASGDGHTDDTVALQEALNLASAPGSIRTSVFLPAGTYIISDTLYWNKTFSPIQRWAGTYGLRLLGCGSNTTIQWAGAAGKAMFLDQGSSRSQYEGLIWNAGPATAAAGFGVVHASLTLYQTRMRHENEEFIGFTGIAGQGTISPPYKYTSTSGTVSTATTLPVGITTIPLSAIPSGLVTGAGVTGTGIPNTGGTTTVTVMSIDTMNITVTISAPTNHTITNGTTLKFISSVAGTPETVAAAGIIAGTTAQASPMAETIIWNCFFKGDTKGVDFARDYFNNYVWVFKSCEFEQCGTAISGADGKAVVMDCHFEGTTGTDISVGILSHVRRCTSIGAAHFFTGPTSSSETMNVIENCWVDGWTNANGALVFNDRSDMVVDCQFSHPPATPTGGIYMWPPNPLDLTLSNNYSATPTMPVVYVKGGTVNQVSIPGGSIAPSITSPSQTFLQSTWPADGSAILDITKAPYNAVSGTDCTAAIQSAITQAKTNNNGSIVYIPVGNYHTSATLNVAGGNYSIQGSGPGSLLTWTGAATTTTPMFTVTTPQNISIKMLAAQVGAVSGVSSQPCVLETSTGASSATYDGIDSGAYTNSPGIVLNSLPAGSTVMMPVCDSPLTVNDCGPAVIFANYVLGCPTVSGATHAKTGFLGALVLECNQMVSSTGWDVIVDDNQDFVGCDFYNEQSFNHLLVSNTHGATWTGRVSFQGMKEESSQPSTTVSIQNFGGRVYYGSQDFIDNNSQPQFLQSGTAAVDLVLIGNDYYSNPSFSLGSSCRLIEENNIYNSPAVTYMANVSPTNWGTSAAAGLDHFRQAGDYDMYLNYGLLQNVVNTSFEADAANPTPTTAIGYTPAGWTVGGAQAIGAGIRNVTVTNVASPFGAGTQGLLWIDNTGSTTGSAISMNQNFSALPANNSTVWTFDFRVNSGATNNDMWARAFDGAGTVSGLHLTSNGTTAFLQATVGGVVKTLTHPTLDTWYRARFVVPPAASGVASATLYLTPWTSTGAGTTTPYTIDGITATSSVGVERVYFSSGTGPGANQNINIDNISATNNSVYSLP